MSKQIFQKFLIDNNIKDLEILETSGSTHTAQEAADAHGLPVRNIIKSLLVKNEKNFFMVLVPGDVRMDLNQLSAQISKGVIKMATPDETKEITGHSIGGVPPFGHLRRISTYIYPGFDKQNTLLAAAGSSNSVLKINYKTLIKITSAKPLQDEK